MAFVRRTTALALAAVLGASALTACTEPLPEPDAAADALAAALASGDFSGAPLNTTDQSVAAAQAEEVLGALTDIPRAVVVQSISEPDAEAETPTATAQVAWTWDIDATDADWTYTVPLELTLVADAWQATWSRDLLAPALGEAGVLTIARTTAARADVLGAGDTPLVTERDVYRIGIDKTFTAADNWEAAALALATELDFDDPAAYAERVLSAGERAFVEAIVVRQEDPGEVDMAAVRAIEGVGVIDAVLPLAPTATFARPILGRVGEATAEIVAESDGAIAAGDVVGLAGLQLQYDETLRGTPGTVISVTEGDVDTEIFTAAPVAGTNLATTLDERLQLLAEEILGPIEPASAIVALRPSTGEVLAAASGAGGEGYSTATLGQYAPGSTFKIVTTLALLRSGMSLTDTVSCTEAITVDGREFNNYPGYPASALGEITLSEAIANSCNTALIALAEQLPADAVAEAALALGLGADGDLAFPAFRGSVPTDAAGTAHAASLIGQGDVLASPLAMATVAASVAHGAAVTPVLVRIPEGADGAASAAPADPPAPLTSAEAASLAQVMRSVVTEGTAIDLLDVPGEPVAAKSGTAEHGSEDPPLTSAWMIAFQGDLAVAVFVEVGVAGAQTAGPLMEQFLRGAQG